VSAAPSVACTEAGPFNESDARRFESRIAALDLGARVSHQEVESQEVTGWIVNVPPQPTREAAERKAAELRELGVTDFYIMPADSGMKYAISLGMFKTESGAQTLLANLTKQGVHTARITPRGPQTTHLVYRLRNLDAPTRERVAAIATRLDEASVRNCGAAR
jgi:cell division septation protein DedD